jgi:hypothetical protein
METTAAPNSAEPKAGCRWYQFSRRYNGAMPKPFQFTIGRMLFAVACFSVTAWSSSTLFSDDNAGIGVLCYVLSSFSAGAGIGVIDGRAIKVAKWGIVWAVLMFVGMVGQYIRVAQRSTNGPARVKYSGPSLAPISAPKQR